MAEKKHYLIRVWDISGFKTPNLEQVKDNKSFIIKEENTHYGFNLVQEKIIKCYESNIQNLYVPKGFRSTYEEVEAPKEDKKKAHISKS